MFVLEVLTSQYKIYKMKETVNKFLLAGDKFVLEMHLRLLGFKYSACGPFTEIKERIKKIKETRNSQYNYQNELGKVCFQHDLVYRDFKYLTKRTVPDKTLSDKGFNISKNPKYDGYQCGLASMVYNFFDKKTSGITVKSENISNKKLAEELH